MNIKTKSSSLRKLLRFFTYNRSTQIRVYSKKKDGKDNDDGDDKKNQKNLDIKSIKEEKPKKVKKNVDSQNNYIDSQHILQYLPDEVKIGDDSIIWSDQSFIINLYRGILNTSQIFPFPRTLDSDQRKEVEDAMKPILNFLKNENNPKINDEREEMPSSFYKKMHELGMLRVGIPKEFGGYGFNHSQLALFSRLYGIYDLSIAAIVSGHQCLGAKAIRMHGSLEQQKKYLPMIAKEGKIAALAILERASETDLVSIQSRAKLTEDKKHYILNGTKINVINGGIADIFTVLTLTESLEHELEISVMIVEKSFGGIVAGPSTQRLGMRAVNSTTVEFKNVPVPVENIVGKTSHGHMIAMHVLNHSRFGCAATLAGAMKTTLEMAVEFSANRKQFGRFITSYGAVQGKIATMAIHQYVNECLAYMIAGNMDSGFTDAYVEAAITKCFSSKVAFESVDEALQIFGSRGYERNIHIERHLRDIRYFRFYCGTNDILRLFISLTGIQHASIDRQDIQAAYKNPQTHLGLVMGLPKRLSVKRQYFYGMTPTILHLVHPVLLPAAEWATKSIDKFGHVVQLLLDIHGSNIIEKQYQLIQLANAAIYAYAMVATLSRCNVALYNDAPSAAFERALTEAFVSEAASFVKGTLAALESRTRQNIRAKLEVVTNHIVQEGMIHAKVNLNK